MFCSFGGILTWPRCQACGNLRWHQIALSFGENPLGMKLGASWVW
jgi:hypothetical protein